MRSIKRIDNHKTALLLRQSAQKRGLNQRHLSEKIGLNQSQVSRLMSGRFQRRTTGLDALCAELGVRMIYTTKTVELRNFPELASCLADVLDGSKSQERAVVNLLRSAQRLR